VTRGRRNVLCMKWGVRYPPLYVNRLFAMVRRHLEGEFRFLCLADNAQGLRPEIEVRPIPDLGLPEGAGRWAWPKLGVFHPSLGDLDGDCLFLDLDIVIRGGIDCLFDHAPGRFCIVRDWTPALRKVVARRPGVGNSSVFRFAAGSMNDVLEAFLRDRDRNLAAYRNEQRFLSACAADRLVWWPEEWIASFKRHCLPVFPARLLVESVPPPSARIVVFHGSPKPCEAVRGKWGWRRARPAKWICRDWRE